MPRNARRTWPEDTSWGTSWATVSAGTAKPTTTPPIVSWPVTPITWPSASSSGPPVSPGSAVASVWMTPSTATPSFATSRFRAADTTPTVMVGARPSGLPMAMVGSPTAGRAPPSSSSDVRSAACGSTASSARSVSSSRPSATARTARPSRKVTTMSEAAATVCAFVMTSPLSASMTKPDPASPAPAVRLGANGDRASISARPWTETTAGAAASNSVRAVSPPAPSARPKMSARATGGRSPAEALCSVLTVPEPSSSAVVTAPPAAAVMTVPIHARMQVRACARRVKRR